MEMTSFVQYRVVEIFKKPNPIHRWHGVAAWTPGGQSLKEDTTNPEKRVHDEENGDCELTL
ncbi:hypothetical protein C499_00465 [Halogeometricum borinquense DSM 11551]|uniref:Uncharacterized protein n=1 Tax=Halogeometricum borinquense (strain ATCC 700274 / DSM 11551 / JCM 10706 / KCTC 4070 / PR3) TaxID=469382 RepID=L9V5T2_HALBP|nr:hypothetical protein C499_00465 [Halogeometricum borinquense DSM 11551]